MGARIAIGLLVLAGIILFVRHDAGTVAGLDNSQFAGVVAALALLVYLGGSMLSGYRGRFTGAVRDALFWGILALALIAAYSFRDEMMPLAQRIAGELMPGTPIAFDTGNESPAGVRIRKQVDGHFLAVTQVNGAKINMIVDTGASSVVLNPEDAKRAGIELDGLNYSEPIQTANGRSFAARVRLRNVSIGTVSMDNVDALVTRPGTLRQSLLGMSFLSRLRSYEFSGDFLSLRS